MFRTLLLTTVVGAGVGSTASVPASVPAGSLDARSNNPPSYFCSSNIKKCNRQEKSVAAYCSSYLPVEAIPKVTKTTTRTICATKTATVTAVTGTITLPAQTVTSTISSCVAPPGAPTQEPAPVERRASETNELEQRGASVSKPSCFNDLKARSAIAAACSCYPRNPSTTTVTKTVTGKAKTATRTVGTATTVTASATTTWVFAPESTSFLIANDQGGFVDEFCRAQQKRSESGVGQGTGALDMFDEVAGAILFALNADTTLTALEGSADDPLDGPSPEFRVRIGGAELEPLSCSVSQAPDGTCPLDCTVASDGTDVNQGQTPGPWFLGPPNTVSDVTYNTFAVTRTNPNQRGGCGVARGGARGGAGFTVGRRRRLSG